MDNGSLWLIVSKKKHVSHVNITIFSHEMCTSAENPPGIPTAARDTKVLRDDFIAAILRWWAIRGYDWDIAITIAITTWVASKMGLSQNGWFTETPIYMDDLDVPPF